MSSKRPASAALRGCIDACDRCVRVIDAVSPDVYAGALPGRYPIGSHLRHVIEHFQCFLEGVGEGLVDYDARARDESLERSLDEFRSKLRDVRAALIGMDESILRRAIRIRQTASLDANAEIYDSTTERELVFLSSHTIHHLALVVHLCREHDVDLPEDISLAFSTAAHQQAAKG